MERTVSKAEYNEEKRRKVAKPLMWFGMISIVMLFAGLTSAVIVRKGDGNWMHFELPSMFMWSTIIIVLSSVSLFLASRSAKNNNQSLTKFGIIGTLVLGFIFIVTQLEGYNQLVNMEVYFTGSKHNASGSFLYIISGAHLAHLAGGIIALLVVTFNALKERYNSKNLLGLQVFSTYWHFLGTMWIYLYFFFRLII